MPSTPFARLLFKRRLAVFSNAMQVNEDALDAVCGWVWPRMTVTDTRGWYTVGNSSAKRMIDKNTAKKNNAIIYLTKTPCRKICILFLQFYSTILSRSSRRATSLFPVDTIAMVVFKEIIIPTSWLRSSLFASFAML